MIWKEVEKKYGTKIANKMEKSEYLQGITLTMGPNGKADIPERDIDLAYRDVMGKKIHPLEWD